MRPGETLNSVMRRFTRSKKVDTLLVEVAYMPRRVGHVKEGLDAYKDLELMMLDVKTALRHVKAKSHPPQVDADFVGALPELKRQAAAAARVVDSWRKGPIPEFFGSEDDLHNSVQTVRELAAQLRHLLAGVTSATLGTIQRSHKYVQKLGEGKPMQFGAHIEWGVVSKHVHDLVQIVSRAQDTRSASIPTDTMADRIVESQWMSLVARTVFILLPRLLALMDYETHRQNTNKSAYLESAAVVKLAEEDAKRERVAQSRAFGGPEYKLVFDRSVMRLVKAIEDDMKQSTLLRMLHEAWYILTTLGPGILFSFLYSTVLGFVDTVILGKAGALSSMLGGPYGMMFAMSFMTLAWDRYRLGEKLLGLVQPARTSYVKGGRVPKPVKCVTFA